MSKNRPQRLPTAFTGTYRTPRGFECKVDVDDLSLGGCRVDDARGGLILGEYVQITIEQAGPFTAEVAWRQSTRVGLQFNRALPAHIVKELTGVDVNAAPPDEVEPDPKAAVIPRPYIAPETSSSDDEPATPQSGGLRRFI